MYFGCTDPPIRPVRTDFDLCACADPQKCCRPIELRCMKNFQKYRESSQIFYISSRLHRKFSRFFCPQFRKMSHPFFISSRLHRIFFVIRTYVFLQHLSAGHLRTRRRLPSRTTVRCSFPLGKTKKSPRSTFEFHFFATKLTNNICHRAFFVAEVERPHTTTRGRFGDAKMTHRPRSAAWYDIRPR